MHTTHTRLDIAYRERTPKSISKISEKFKEMDDIKLILEVEKHRELYDLQHQFDKDNVDKDQCWDIANAMFMYHVSVKESSE